MKLREKLGVSCVSGKACAGQAARDVTIMFQVVSDVLLIGDQRAEDTDSMCNGLEFGGF